MPFQSEKQRRYLHANHPEIAKRWERDYANGGILDINESEEIISDDGNDIELTDYNAAFDEPTGVKTLFQAKDGGTPQLAKKSKDGKRPGYGGPHDSYDAGQSYSGSTSSSGGNNYHDRIQEIAKQQDNQPSSVYSNPNEDRAREEKAAAQKRALEAQELMRSKGQYVDPILSMVGKKIVTDPNTGGRITVDDQAILMPEHKLVDNKFAKTRKAKWVSLEEKARMDRIDKVAEEIRNSWSYKTEKKIGQRMVDMAISLVGIPGLGIILSLLGLKPNVIPKRNIAGDIMEDQVTGADLGWFQDTDWEGVDPEFEKDWSELWKKGPDDTGGDGPDVVPIPQIIEGYEEMAARPMSLLDTRNNPALFAQLLEKWRQEKLAKEQEYRDYGLLPGDNNPLMLQANSGGLANLFRVKNQ